MAIEKRTIYAGTEIGANGLMSLRLRKQVLEDGKEIFGEWHRVTIEPDTPMADIVKVTNASLAQLGCNAIPDEAIERVKKLREVEHTPERVAAYKADREERMRREREAGRGRPPA